MAVGIPITKNDIDYTAGNLGRELESLISRSTKFNDWLGTKTESDLVALGYTAGEVATLKSAYTQLVAGWEVLTGVQAVATPNNFLYFIRQLEGFGF